MMTKTSNTNRAHDVIREIVDYAENIAGDAGVGSSETAGVIVSFLAQRPGLMASFMAGTLSAVDTGMLDHHNGVLSWHGMDGGIHRPDPSKARFPAPAPEALPARTAYDDIGSGVKADSGWVEWAGGDTPVEPGTEGLIRVEDGEVIYTKQLGSFNFAHDRSGPFPGRRIVAYRVLSTHTAAGAGPVGEAVALRDRLIAEHTRLHHALDLKKGVHVLHDGDIEKLATLILDAAILADRPVEPGEVERLVGRVAMQAHDIETFWKPQFDEQVTRAETAETAFAKTTRERDEARAETKAETRRADSFAQRAFAAEGAYGADGLWKATEAALAEMRERLAKQEEHTFRIVAENDKLRELADAAEELLTVSNLRGETDCLDPIADPGLWTSRRNEAWSALEEAIVARAALSTQESSAALADGKGTGL